LVDKSLRRNGFGQIGTAIEYHRPDTSLGEEINQRLVTLER
jgi:hypothetical protein